MNPFSKPIIGQYMPGDSPVHRMDPRAKLVFVFVYLIVVFWAQTPAAYLLLTFINLTGVRLSQVSWRSLFRGMKPILWLIAVTALLHVFLTKGGDLWWHWGPITIYEQGVTQAGWISSRFILLITMATLLTLTTTPMDLTEGMERLMKPLKRIGVPVHELALMISIALRFIPTLWEETEKIMRAQMARGADFESGGMIKRAKSFVPILIPLFVSALKRAEDLAMAMEARAYRGGEGRTRLRELRLSRLDWALWTVMSGMIIGLWVLQTG
jgi:energy-coupling factor transport system permease protein